VFYLILKENRRKTW